MGQELRTPTEEVSKMEFTEIMNLIGSFGFPIVMCVLFWHYISTCIQEIMKTVDKNTDAVNTLILKIDIIDAIAQHEKEKEKEKK